MAEQARAAMGVKDLVAGSDSVEGARRLEVEAPSHCCDRGYCDVSYWLVAVGSP